jgi:hypothetical protein
MNTGNFYWWVGVVEDRNDPLKLGRYRVRVLGYHNERKDVQPIEDLPWAHCLLPVTAASSNGVGETPNIVEGSWVFGFFQDGNSSQIPIIFGTSPGLPQIPDEDPPDFIGMRDTVPEKEGEAEFEGQQTRDKQPRKLQKRTLNGGGEDSTFTEEFGSKDARQPQADGHRDEYDLIEFLDERGETGGDLSPLATETDTTTNALNENSKDEDFVGSERIVKHKIDTLDKLVPIAVPLQDLEDELVVFIPQKLTCTQAGGQLGIYDGIKEQERDPEELKVDIEKPSGEIEQEITSVKSPDQPRFEESNKAFAWDEPSTQLYPVYPHNQVKETESGHIIEYDDTPGQERIHEFHRTGTFREIHPDGTKVEKIVNDNYSIYMKNNHVHVEGTVYLTVDRSSSIYINAEGEEDQSLDIQIGEGANLNLELKKGDANIRLVEGDLLTYIDKGDMTTYLKEGDLKTSLDEGDIEIWTAGDIRVEAGNNLYINVDGGADIKVEKDVCLDVGGDLKAKVGGDVALDVRGNLKAFIKKQAHIHSIDRMTLTSNNSILMKAPRIDLNPHLG